MLMDQQSQMHKQQLEMMKMVQQQIQALMALLEKATSTKWLSHISLRFWEVILKHVAIKRVLILRNLFFWRPKLCSSLIYLNFVELCWKVS